MENYFTTQRDNVFRNVEVLIYVFDVESREVEKDMHYYQSCLEAILQVCTHYKPLLSLLMCV
jgi:Ras-related GTP-binding protein A/B